MDNENKPLSIDDLEMEGDQYVINLIKPFTYKEEMVQRLLFREPTMEDITIISKLGDELTQTKKLVSILANIPMDAVNMICVRDMNLNIKTLLEFLMGESQQTGQE